MLDLVEPNISARFLDCGCGGGGLTAAMARKIGTAHVEGIEMDLEDAESARTLGVNVHRGVDLNEPLPFEDGSFDVVLASNVLEHIYHTDLLIKEVHRVLSPGGMAIFSMPNLTAVHNLALMLIGWQPFTASVSAEVYLENPLHPHFRTECLLKPLGHLRLFTAGALKRLMEYHGFQVDKLTGTGFPPFTGRIPRILSWLLVRYCNYLVIKVRK